METTVDIAAGLLEEARKLAAHRGTTTEAVIEASLRRYLAAENAGGFRLKDGSFRGRGLQTGIREGDWSIIRAHVYEGRGG